MDYLSSVKKEIIIVLIFYFILLFVIPKSYGYTYADVQNYAGSVFCTDPSTDPQSGCYQAYCSWPVDCCRSDTHQQSSSFYDSCHGVQYPCTCEIESRADGGYDVSLKANSYDYNWFDREIAVGTTCNNVLCSGSCATNNWKTAGCDGNKTMDDVIGSGNYYCTTYNPDDYVRECDGLYHLRGSGNCNGTCPIRVKRFTVGTAPKVYTSGLCDIVEWAVTPVGNCNWIPNYVLLRSYSGPPAGGYGANNIGGSSMGFGKEMKGQKGKGYGGYERH